MKKFFSLSVPLQMTGKRTRSVIRCVLYQISNAFSISIIVKRFVRLSRVDIFNWLLLLRSRVSFVYPFKWKNFCICSWLLFKNFFHSLLLCVKNKKEIQNEFRWIIVWMWFNHFFPLYLTNHVHMCYSTWVINGAEQKKTARIFWNIEDESGVDIILKL